MFASNTFFLGVRMTRGADFIFPRQTSEEVRLVCCPGESPKCASRFFAETLGPVLWEYFQQACPTTEGELYTLVYGFLSHSGVLLPTIYKLTRTQAAPLN
jgi:hypothetical protein